MQWFGESWGAPICAEAPQTEPPVGRPCLYCKEAIGPFDRGFILPYYKKDEVIMAPYHYSCFLRSVGIAEQDSEC